MEKMLKAAFQILHDSPARMEDFLNHCFKQISRKLFLNQASKIPHEKKNQCLIDIN